VDDAQAVGISIAEDQRTGRLPLELRGWNATPVSLAVH
jgi:hypothetical protein